MSNTKNTTFYKSLAMTVSAMAVASACGLVADAQTYTTTTGFQTVTINSTFASSYKVFKVASGTKAVIVPSWAAQTWAVGSNTAVMFNPSAISTNNPCKNGSLAWDKAASCLYGGPLIQVDKGATLVLGGTQTNGGIAQGYGFEDAIHADGDVILEDEGVQLWDGKHALDQFVGSNYFGGNLTMAPGALATFGMSWDPAFTAFGANTNVTLGAASVMDIYQNTAQNLVMGGALAGSGTLNLHTGTLIINGANTAANPFTGTLSVSPSQNLVIGDSAAHSTALLGDPAHPSANTLTLLGTTSGAPVLRGTGTVAENVVNNGGVVWPGYTGTLSNLTVQNYTQNGLGTLKVEVDPNNVAGLHVLGNAALDGTLVVTIDKGNYQTKVYNIVQVDGAMTGGFTSIKTTSDVVGAIAAVTKTANGYQVVTEVVQGAAAPAPIAVGHLVSANRLNNLYLVNSLHDRLSNAPTDATEVGHNKYVWIEGFGRHSSVSRNDVGYHTTAEGITAGAEYRPAWHNTTVGLALSFSNESLKAKGATTGNTSSLSVAAYGGFDLNYMRLDASAFYNTYKSSLKRDFGTSGVAQAKPDGEANGISIQLSHAYVTGLVTPYIRGVYTRQHLAGATESGSALLNLQYNAINANTFVGDVGFRIDPTRYLHSEKTKLLINIALEHDFSTLGESVTGLFPITTGQTWSAYWRGDSENTALVGIDVARQIADGLEVTGRLNGRASLYQTSGELSLAAKYRF